MYCAVYFEVETRKQTLDERRVWIVRWQKPLGLWPVLPTFRTDTLLQLITVPSTPVSLSSPTTLFIKFRISLVHHTTFRSHTCTQRRLSKLKQIHGYGQTHTRHYPFLRRPTSISPPDRRPKICECLRERLQSIGIRDSCPVSLGEVPLPIGDSPFSFR